MYFNKIGTNLRTFRREKIHLTLQELRTSDNCLNNFHNIQFSFGILSQVDKRTQYREF